MRFCLILAMAIGLSSAVYAAPFDDADAAYTAGDYVTALKLVEPLAKKGDARAQNLLGVMYDLGRGVPKNVETAVTLYRQAAEQEHADGQNNLGLMYMMGSGVEANPTEAVKWFRKSALNGNGFGHHNYAMMNEKGNGTPQNLVRAYAHYSLIEAAAAKGDPSFLTQPNKHRDTVATMMNPDQIRQAQELAKTCFETNYKNCD